MDIKVCNRARLYATLKFGFGELLKDGWGADMSLTITTAKEVCEEINCGRIDKFKNSCVLSLGKFFNEETIVKLKDQDILFCYSAEQGKWFAYIFPEVPSIGESATVLLFRVNQEEILPALSV